MDLDHVTGGTVEGWPEVVQSILTILGTPRAARVFRRDFGSGVPALIDAPMNDAGVLALYVAVAEALDKFEPRFELTNVSAQAGADGRMIMTLEGHYRPRAHVGDFSIAADGVRAVRMLPQGATAWRLAE